MFFMAIATLHYWQREDQNPRLINLNFNNVITYKLVNWCSNTINNVNLQKHPTLQLHSSFIWNCNFLGDCLYSWLQYLHCTNGLFKDQDPRWYNYLIWTSTIYIIMYKLVKYFNSIHNAKTKNPTLQSHSNLVLILEQECILLVDHYVHSLDFERIH